MLEGQSCSLPNRERTSLADRPSDGLITTTEREGEKEGGGERERERERDDSGGVWGRETAGEKIKSVAKLLHDCPFPEDLGIIW